MFDGDQFVVYVQAQMTNQASPVEEQEKLLEEALNVVKVQVSFDGTWLYKVVSKFE